MSFVQPWWLLAAPLMIPVALLPHLISRMRGYSAYFPAVRWLQVAAAEAHRKKRFRDFWLMFLRMTALLLVVIAFARPAVLGQPEDPGFDSPTHLVILLDRSASMSRSNGEKTLFEQAVDRAVTEIDRLTPERDLLSVVLIDGHPSSLGRGPTEAFGEVRTLLRQLDPTDEAAQVQQALRLAQSQIAHGSRMTRSVRVIESGPRWQSSSTTDVSRRPNVLILSDLLATAWNPVDEWHFRQALSGAEAVSIEPLSGREENFFWSNLQARLIPSARSPGAHLTAILNNASDRDAVIQARLRFGRHESTASVAIQARGTATIEERFPFDDDTEWTAATVELLEHEDALPPDDRSGTWLRRPALRNVWLIGEGRMDRLNADSILARALAPDLPMDFRGDEPWSSVSGGVRLRMVNTAALARLITDGALAQTADRPEAIIIGRIADLDDATTAALVQYALSGGALLWFAQGPTFGVRIAQLAQPVPGELGIITRRAPAGTERTGLRPPDRDLGQDMAMQPRWLRDHLAAMAIMRFTPEWLLDVDPDHVELDWRYADGGPAVATRFLGAGQITFAGFPLEPGRSDLIVGPTLLIWLDQWLEQLPRREPWPGRLPAGSDRQLELDEPIQAGESWRWMDARDRTVAEGRRPEGTGPLWNITLPRLSRAGDYRLEVEGQVVGRIMTHVPRAESHLAPLDHAAKSQLDRSARQISLQAGLGMFDVPPPRPIEKEWWPYLVLIALLALLTEQGLLHYWRRNRSGTDARLAGSGADALPGHALAIKGLIRD
ncbi:MAG: BatA and WFA domain-containing protein [Phycisphaeraceae bacterium]|nr:BatA and WFA domain-containing protein [Phycisphaeraceae bacterium]